MIKSKKDIFEILDPMANEIAEIRLLLTIFQSCDLEWRQKDYLLRKLMEHINHLHDLFQALWETLLQKG